MPSSQPASQPASPVHINAGGSRQRHLPSPPSHTHCPPSCCSSKKRAAGFQDVWRKRRATGSRKGSKGSKAWPFEDVRDRPVVKDFVDPATNKTRPYTGRVVDFYQDKLW